MAVDLYAALGVGRSDNRAAVRAAYRKVAKSAHPDAPGGSAKRFALVKLAHDTLTDEARRRHYDETGEVDEKPVDNRQAMALQCVATALEATLAECQSTNQNPERVDLADRMRRWIKAHLAASAKQLADLETIIAKNEALGRRFIGDVMQQIISGRITMLRSNIARIQSNNQAGQDALILLEPVAFKAEATPPTATQNSMINYMRF